MTEHNETLDYRTDSVYDIHYAAGLSPELMRMALVLQGVAMPAVSPGEPFRYLELGYGMGLSVNIHAATVPGEYWGTDFLPQHAEDANAIAAAAGLTDYHLLNKSFEEMDAMSEAGELPQFDVIGFHGIWSWINEENRQHMWNVVNRNLKDGGVVYNSYNAQPGWSYFMPVRELMTINAERLGEERDILERTRETLEYVNELANAGAVYFKVNPMAMNQLRSLSNYSANYLAQEYLNRSWKPFYFVEVAEDMARAGCSFVSSTSLLNQTGALIPPATRPLLARTLNHQLRETLRDFAMNQRFRADLFVRNPKRLNSREHREALMELGLLLVAPRDQIDLTLPTAYGTVNLDPKLYNPLVDALVEGGVTVKKIGEIMEAPEIKKMDFRLLIECLSVLVGKNVARPAVPKADPVAAATSAGLNRELCRRASLGVNWKCLASPLLGGGVALSDMEQLFLYFRPDNEEDVEGWSKEIFKNMVGRGMHLTYDESLPKITAALHDFIKDRLPFLRYLGVAF